jgi:hypothetical protein
MRKFLAGNSNCAVALAVVLLAALTGSSSPNVGLSDASGSHASAVLAGPTKPACGSNELVIYQRSLSSGQPRCEAASRPAASPDYSSVDVGFSDAPDSDPSAAAAPPTLAHGSNELVAYQPNPSPSGEPTSEVASNAPTSLGYAMRSSSDVELLDASRSNPSAPAVPTCGSNELGVYHPNLSPVGEPACGASPGTAAEIAEARAYLIETASPGYTMTLQGPELAIGRLHPEFAVRLEHAIREARSAGLSSAGVFSAYRPPAFGVGGFSDKFNSLHTYGLAVDMRGIGNPGSPEAQLWHQIAAKNGVVCPYGPRARTEWNHCQPTSVRIILAENPLRDTVSSAGPFDLETMFEAGNSLIEDKASAADSLSRAVAPPPVRTLEDLKPTPLIVASHRTKRNSREADKSARHAKLAPRGSVKEKPIIAVEERAVEERRVGAKSVRQAKLAPRGSVKEKPIIAVEERHVDAKSARQAKLAPRGRVKGTPIIAVEEGRRKSKSGRA